MGHEIRITLLNKMASSLRFFYKSEARKEYWILRPSYAENVIEIHMINISTTEFDKMHERL